MSRYFKDLGSHIYNWVSYPFIYGYELVSGRPIRSQQNQFSRRPSTLDQSPFTNGSRLRNRRISSRHFSSSRLLQKVDNDLYFNDDSGIGTKSLSAGQISGFYELGQQQTQNFDDTFNLFGNFVDVFNENSSGSTKSYSLLNVTVPFEDESPAFLASLPDTSFPRFRVVLPKRSKILVLDLDETLVHSTSKSSKDCDYMVEVLIDRSSCLYYVFKRPFVDYFLETVVSVFLMFLILA